jgi:hypothetical protein
MSLDQLLAMSDPARDLPAGATDPDSPVAQALLARISAQAPARRPAARGPVHARTLRRALVGGALAGAAATVLLAAPMPWEHDGPGPVARAYAVSRHGDAVRVTVHWRELTDPAALQAALDRAGAHVKVFVHTAAPSATRCPAPGNTVGYSARAVQWTVPQQDEQDSGFVVHPGDFPDDGTFVVSVAVAPAGATGGSTFAPGRPQIEQISSYMVVGAVPTCAP